MVIAESLRSKLETVFGQLQPDCTLFSGGLDSSIAAALSGCKTGILVTLGNEAPDIEHARRVASALDMDIIHRVVDFQEAIEAIPDVIRILRSFDPAIPNDVTVYFGLKEAHMRGFRSVMTGDGADELFGGYSYMADLPDLDGYIRHLAGTMSFNSQSLGRHFDQHMMQPFLHPEIVDIALGIPPSLKIRQHDGKLTGKWILRTALKAILPEDELWQDKRPLETGSGMTALNAALGSQISDEHFHDSRLAENIHFFNKAHLFYYETYRTVVGKIPPRRASEDQCGGCAAGIPQYKGHCRICGWTKGINYE